jgi:hypothetical protein
MYEQGFYNPEDGILHSHRRENPNLTRTLLVMKEVRVLFVWFFGSFLCGRYFSHLKGLKNLQHLEASL